MDAADRHRRASRSTSRSAAAGPPSFSFPGLVGLLDAWEFQMAEFSKRYRCISFDHRGAGDSDKPKDGYSTELSPATRSPCMDALGIDKAHVAGTSTGGCVLQNLAIDHPERAALLHLLQHLGEGRRVHHARADDAQAHRALLRPGGIRQALVAVHQRRDAVPLQSRQGDGARAARAADGGAGRGAGAAARHDAGRTTARAELHKIRNPSLIVGTRDDATVPSYQSEDLHKAIAGSRLVIVEEGGHYSYRRHWQEWNKIVDAFLKETEGTAFRR